MAISPSEPVENFETAPAQVTVTFGLDEEAEGSPQLHYVLDDGAPVEITNLQQLAPTSGVVQVWQGSFTLPGDAGLDNAETLSFNYSGQDVLGNVATEISGKNAFQVFQGDLPPLPAPLVLKGWPRPAGQIELSWSEVEGASGYKVFRKTQGTVYGEVGEVFSGQVSFTDSTPAEDSYTYVVATVRNVNDKTAVSGYSPSVTIDSDATTPAAPAALNLELMAQGIHATWQAISEPEAKYALYRSETEITDVSGLTPVVSDIEGTEAIDEEPSVTHHYYAVTALDEAGNESAPSPSVYLNFSLLPVRQLAVEQRDTLQPVVTWLHPGGDIEGFHVYVNGQQVTLIPQVETSFTDTGYSDGVDRTFEIVAVDALGEEGPKNKVVLPAVVALPQEGEAIKRNIMNRVSVDVTNSSSEDIPQAKVALEIAGVQYPEDTVFVRANDTDFVSLVVPGESSLEDTVPVTTTLVISKEGTTARRIRTSTLPVSYSSLVLVVMSEGTTRGGEGRVRFVLENTGDASIDLVTAGGPQAETVITLLDEDKNVLATAGYEQKLGENVTTLSNGYTVARIAPGSVLSSQVTTMAIPANAPDQVTFEVDVTQVHYGMDTDQHVALAGPMSRKNVTLIDTSYVGQITQVTPEVSFGGQEITITGRSVKRTDGTTTAYVPLRLVVSHNGLERRYTVSTGQNGYFSYGFTPQGDEAGEYETWVTHPDVDEAANRVSFKITKLAIAPAEQTIVAPYNVERSGKVTVTAAKGTVATNLRLSYLPQDQPGGAFMTGVFVTLPTTPVVVDTQEPVDLAFTVSATADAPSTGTLVFALTADERPGADFGKAIVNVAFDSVKPVFVHTPTLVETGVEPGTSVNELVELSNTGLGAAIDTQVALLTDTGQPPPIWASLASASSLGDIEPGGKAQVTLFFAPTASVTEGVYDFLLRVTNSASEDYDVPISVAVTSNPVGGLLFKVSDIYTGTIDRETQELIEGLEGARVSMTQVEDPSYVRTLDTDDAGEAFFQGLPAGMYQARISGGSHESVVRQVVVRPGVTGTEAVFLQNVLVSVEWHVTETTIEDHYTITLDATFETEVPAAVVVANPASVELPAMSPGDIYMGEFTLTNHGLIQAQEFYMSKPDGKGFFDIELLAEIPEVLGAHEVLTVPYRVVCLRSLTDTSDTGGADECYGFYTFTKGGYSYVCANGNKSSGSVSHYMTRATGRCGHEDVGHDDSGAGADVPPISASPVELEGVDCWPFPGGCPTCGKCPPEQNTNTGSEVNGFTGQYTDELTDLRVKVRGGYIDITRYYYADVKEFYINRPKDNEGVTVHEQYVYAWRFKHGKHNRLLTNGLGTELGEVNNETNLYIGGAKYEPEGSRWVREYNFIVATPAGDGYRWQSTDGDWKLFDKSGYLQSYGDRYGPTATMIYEADGKTLTGISDRNGDQVIWFENATADGTFTAVRDYTGRRVDYNMSYEMAYAEHAGIPSPTLQIYSVTQHPDRNDSSKDITATYTYEPNGVFIQSDIDGDGDLDSVPINAFYMTHAEELNGRTKTITYSPLGLAKKVDDGHGAIYTFDYKYETSTSQYKTTVTLPCGRVKSVTFTKEGKVESTVINGKTVASYAGPERNRVSVDEGGRATQREYDEYGNLTKITYPNGTTESWVYDTELNLPIRHVDKLGVITEKEYSPEGSLLRMSEAVGTDLERLTVYTYNDDGQTLSRTVSGKNGEDAITVSWTYNDKGIVASDTDGEGHTAHYDLFDAEGNNLERRDRRGYTWQQEFDELGRLVKTISPPDPQGRNAIVQYEHDRAGNVVRTIDPKGYVIRNEFDHKGRLVASIDALGARSERAYNAAGLLATFADARGNSTSYIYDDRGRQVAVVDPLGYAEVTEYDEQGRVVTRIDKEGFSTTLVYKTNSDLIAEQRDAKGNVTKRFYDLADRVVAVTDPLGKRTEQEFNEYGQQTVLRRFLNGKPVEKRTVFDFHNRKIVEIDEAGITTNFEYDSNSRLVRTIFPSNDDGGRPAVVRGYDEESNLTCLTSALNHTTEFYFDPLGRLEKVTDPMGYAVSYVRDLNGNIVAKTDSKGQETVFTYNETHRLVRVDYADGEWAELVYDLVGNRTSVVGPCETTTTTLTLSQTFDELNRVTSQSNDDTMRHFQYTYTPRGLRSSMLLLNIESNVQEQITHYVWNENGQIRKILPWIGSPIEFKYGADGSKQSVTLPNGMKRSYSFNDLNQLTELLYENQEGKAVAFFRCSYGPSGNVLSITDNEGLSLYKYNSLNWLIRADYPDGTWESFQYDLEGNRVALGTESGQTDYAYNASSRLMHERGARNVDYAWDENGNIITKMTEGGTETYLWDARDRLRQIVQADGQSIQNTYLPLCNLRRSTATGINTEKKYVWDMLTENSVQVISPEVNAVTDYINGLQVDDLYGMNYAGSPFTYVTDALGTVRSLYASDRTLMNNYTYKAFGEIRHEIEAIPNERRFASRTAVDSGSLYFNRARYLDAGSGRFISADYFEDASIDIEPFSEKGLERFLEKYNYAKNNPISNLDPSGHLTLVEIGIAILVVAVGVAILTAVSYLGNTGAKHCLGIEPPEKNLHTVDPAAVKLQLQKVKVAWDKWKSQRDGLSLESAFCVLVCELLKARATDEQVKGLVAKAKRNKRYKEFAKSSDPAIDRGIKFGKKAATYLQDSCKSRCTGCADE